MAPEVVGFGASTKSKNTLRIPIGQRPLMSFAIANNLLAHGTKATDLGISPHATATILWTNSKNPKKIDPLIWSTPKCVHIPSQISHSKTNEEYWLRLGQTKPYPKQRCDQAYNKK